MGAGSLGSMSLETQLTTLVLHPCFSDTPALHTNQLTFLAAKPLENLEDP